VVVVVVAVARRYKFGVKALPPHKRIVVVAVVVVMAALNGGMRVTVTAGVV
jgi:hypothetical protein